MSDLVLTSTYNADQRQDSCSIEQRPRSRQSYHGGTRGGVDTLHPLEVFHSVCSKIGTPHEAPAFVNIQVQKMVFSEH